MYFPPPFFLIGSNQFCSEKMFDVNILDDFNLVNNCNASVKLSLKCCEICISVKLIIIYPSA